MHSLVKKINILILIGFCPLLIFASAKDLTVYKNTTLLSFTDITSTALPSAPSAGSHCAAFTDITGDGLPDLYMTMYYTADISDLFYVNSALTVFSEDASARGIDDYDGGSHGAVFADLDNDGDFDLINGTTVKRSGTTIIGADHNNIFRNDGSGSFTDITNTISDIYSTAKKTRSVVAFDMDNDGDLDIFTVSGYLGTDDGTDYNEVYRNNGTMSFTALTNTDCGDLYNAPAGQGATDTDYDNDGDIDIICANRTGDLNILQNDGTGNFTLISPASIGISHRAGDGITMGDIDNDGDLDMLLVTGGAEGSAALYKNDGHGTFTFSASWSGITGYMGNFADIDNDCDLDLIFTGDTKCYINSGTGSFSQGASITYTTSPVDPRSISFADIDNDGDIDFAMGDKKSTPHIIQNNLSSENNWIKIILKSPSGQPGAFGAKIELFSAGHLGGTLIGYREARSSTGYITQDDPVIHFGTGTNSQVDVKVTFLDGTTAQRTFVSVNQTITIDHPDVLAELKVFLEGPYDTTTDLMKTGLNSAGLIPLTSPYPEDPRTVSSVPADVVDWVLIQARTQADGTAVISKSAFLKKDGKIVSDNGTTENITLALEQGSYYILVKHRNHVKIMSKNTVSLDYSSATLFDFTNETNLYETISMKEIKSGIWVMLGGDATGDGYVNAHDKNIQWRPNNGTYGYKSSDMNLDSFINATDKNEIWRVNNGRGTSIN